jgi:phenylalanyl-tRNA synthetase beta chain
MKISLNWLSKFVDVPLIENYTGMVIGKVLELDRHPNAEKLNVAKVDVGTEVLQIVCGGANLEKGQTVAVAQIGCTMPNGMKIMPVELRGVASNGMICSKEELNLGPNAYKEIMVLDGNLKPGTPLKEALQLKGYTAQELQELFTIRTAEVEGVEKFANKLQHVVTGKILEYEKIAGSDKLHRATINIGSKKIQLIFGSVHAVKIGWIVPIALPGAVMANGLVIKKAKIHDTDSEGMIADDKELGVENTQEGLTIFPPKTALGMPIAEALDLEDIILEIDNKSLTHRPDLWGHYGIAREFAAMLDTKLKPYEKAAKIATLSEEKSSLKLTINKEICPRFTTCVIKGVTVEESPMWLRRDLIAIGVRPINNIVDVTNYVMHELGQPMHAYDRKVVGTDTLEVRYAKKGEKLETIDHKHQDLHEEDPVITNGKQVLTIAGVMGGAHSEISDTTTEIILESANWQPAVVRKASQRHGLRTDAVQRFEKSLDSEMTMTGLLRAIALIQKICPKAEVEGGIADEYLVKIPTRVITVEPEKIIGKIGITLSITEIKSLLEKLAFGVKILSGKPKKLEVTVPSWRATKDINNEDDILEEVARAHGYEKIVPTLPSLPTRLPEENPARKLEHTSRTILSYQLGLTEVYNYSFYGKDELEKSHLAEDIHLKLDNYLSSEQTHLRTTLIPNLLKNLTSNLRFTKKIAIYEIGRTYNEEGDFFPREEKIIAGAIINSDYPSTFLAAKGVVDAYAKALSLQLQDWQKGTTYCPTAHPNRYAELQTTGAALENESPFAKVYELHPEVARAYDLPSNVAIFEINLTKLLREPAKEKRFSPIPKFPGIELDIAVLIDKKITAATLKKAIHEANPTLIKRAHLFDQYEGSNIETTKKSLTFNVLLQSEDRTLADEDMTTTQKNITKNLEALGGVIR